MTEIENQELKIVICDSFLSGQLDLHKIAFAETGDDKHLRTMLQFKETLNSFRYLRETLNRVALENQRLKNTNFK
jgi:hypothetical protein